MFSINSRATFEQFDLIGSDRFTKATYIVLLKSNYTGKDSLMQQSNCWRFVGTINRFCTLYINGFLCESHTNQKEKNIHMTIHAFVQRIDSYHVALQQNLSVRVGVDKIIALLIIPFLGVCDGYYEITLAQPIWKTSQNKSWGAHNLQSARIRYAINELDVSNDTNEFSASHLWSNGEW